MYICTLRLFCQFRPVKAPITMTSIVLLLCSPWIVLSSPAPHPNPTVVARQSNFTPNFFDIPPPAVPSPWSSALPVFTALSDCGDVNNPSEACGTSLNLSTQGYMYTDGTCSSTQSTILLQAAKDAYSIASNAVGWYDNSANTGGIPTAHYCKSFLFATSPAYNSQSGASCLELSVSVWASDPSIGQPLHTERFGKATMCTGQDLLLSATAMAHIGQPQFSAPFLPSRNTPQNITFHRWPSYNGIL